MVFSIKWLLKLAFHIFGLATLVVCTGFVAVVLLHIQANNSFTAREPILLIRYAEIAMAVYGTIYGIYLLSKFIKNLRDSTNFTGERRY